MMTTMPSPPLPRAGLTRNGSIEFGHRHSRPDCQFLGKGLVVDPRKKTPGVEPHDEFAVALVDTEYARIAQQSRGLEHHVSAQSAL
jgi:hypothetical protein